jgi:signal transduction histidine kinase
MLLVTKLTHPTSPHLKPNWIGITTTYLIAAAVFARALITEEMQPFLPRYLLWLIVFIVLFTIVTWKYRLPAWLMHAYLTTQSLITLVLISIRPEFDQSTLLFVVLSYQIALYFAGKMRWIWIAGLVFLNCGSLIYFLKVIDGLALSLSNVAAEIVIPAFIIVSQEIEAARAEGQILVKELQDTHQQLELYASQAEELASEQERIRLARELHDSVSQLIFSINLTTRSAQLLLKKDSSRLPEQLKRLQEMTTEALSQLRSIITQLRPPQQE